MQSDIYSISHATPLHAVWHLQYLTWNATARSLIFTVSHMQRHCMQSDIYNITHETPLHAVWYLHQSFSKNNDSNKIPAMQYPISELNLLSILQRPGAVCLSVGLSVCLSVCMSVCLVVTNLTKTWFVKRKMSWRKDEINGWVLFYSKWNRSVAESTCSFVQ